MIYLLFLLVCLTINIAFFNTTMPPSNKNINAGFVPVGSTNDGLASAAEGLRQRKGGSGSHQQQKEMLQQHFRAVQNMRVYLTAQHAKSRINIDSERSTNDGTTWRVSYNDAKVMKEIQGVRVDKAVTINVVGPTTSPTPGFTNQIVVQVAVSDEVAGAVVDARSNREFVLCVAVALLALLVIALVFLYSGGGSSGSLDDEGIADGANASTQ